MVPAPREQRCIYSPLHFLRSCRRRTGRPRCRVLAKGRDGKKNSFSVTRAAPVGVSPPGPIRAGRRGLGVAGWAASHAPLLDRRTQTRSHCSAHRVPRPPGRVHDLHPLVYAKLGACLLRREACVAKLRATQGTLLEVEGAQPLHARGVELMVALRLVPWPAQPHRRETDRARLLAAVGKRRRAPIARCST